jgi:hypothetical protein
MMTSGASAGGATSGPINVGPGDRFDRVTPTEVVPVPDFHVKFSIPEPFCTPRRLR